MLRGRFGIPAAVFPHYGQLFFVFPPFSPQLIQSLLFHPLITPGFSQKRPYERQQTCFVCCRLFSFFLCIEGFLVFPASPWAGLRTRFSAPLFASGENSLRRKGIPCGKHAVGMRRRTPPSFPGLGRFPAPAERSRPEPAGSRRRNGVIRCLHQITARFLKSYTVHDKIT
jgi:hypothetical protein